MVTFLFCLTVLNKHLQDRPFSFLSYKDTIFAIPARNSWTNPVPRATEFPEKSIDLLALGLDATGKTYSAKMEGWDLRTLSFNVACEDFEHVLAWRVNPRFPPKIRRLPKASEEIRALARKLLLKYPGNGGMTLKEPEVYVADLGAGKEVQLVAASATTKDRNPGIVFLQSPSAAAQELTYVKDGWPHVLTVADLLQDGFIEIIVGGVTPAGKTVTMWKYGHGHLISPPLAHYETPP